MGLARGSRRGQAPKTKKKKVLSGHSGLNQGDTDGMLSKCHKKLRLVFLPCAMHGTLQLQPRGYVMCPSTIFSGMLL